MSEQAHAAAVIARLEAAPGVPAMVVHDDRVPDAGEPGSTPPYVVVRFVFRQLTATEAPAATPLTLDSVAWQIDVQAHCVGTDARSTRGVKGRVRAQLLNWAPTVAGRICRPLRQIESAALGPNEQMGVPVAQQSDTYRFLSQPA